MSGGRGRGARGADPPAPLPAGRRVVDDGTEGSLRAALTANEATERALLAQHARFVEASQSSNADDEHDPEGSTIAFERQQVVALLGQVRSTGEQLRRSLEAAQAGTYSVCEACGGPIDPERLRARPQARTCISCARRSSARR